MKSLFSSCVSAIWRCSSCSSTRNSAVLCCALLLSACGSPYRAPVDTASGGEIYLDDGRTHRVNEGETLYAVAWMYDLDPVALARANSLQEPYVISRGQVLSIDLRAAGITDGRVRNSVAANNAAPAVVAPPTGVRVNPVQGGTGVSRAPLAGGGGLQRTPLPAGNPPPQQPEPAPQQRESAPRQPEPVAPPPTATAPATQTPAAPITSTTTTSVNRRPERSTPVITTPSDAAPATAVAPSPQIAPAVPAVVPPDSAPALPSGPIAWAWPSAGRIIGRFDEASVDKKGIDFDGNKGDPVKAAADGQVVYAGSGLLRFGDLIILKHDDRFLSAYAHNDKILVKEGEFVKQGQVIAELGSSGIDRNMLHFEIRVEGTPVDPLRHLPSR